MVVKMNWSRVIILIGFILGIKAMDMDDMDGPKEFHPINPESKTFHWILSLAVLLILPSIASVLAFANRLHLSLILSIISTGYSIFETLFLDFPDNKDDHENRTSKGTSWFLSILLGLTIFVGSVINGSNIIINKYYPHLASDPSKSRSVVLMRLYKCLTFVAVLTGWVRICMAPIALFGFCYGKHTGQCLAHGIMGTAFIVYGFALSLILVVPWFRNRSNGKPQEFYDSLVMCVWGIVNTFTEHRWGKEPWNMGDYDHTSMGIVWWCGGLLGMWLSRKDKRSFIPAILLIYTGWSMSQHVQHLELSTKVHAMFGLVLMGSGFSRIIEISFVLKDNYSSDSGKIISFQYFPPFCLVLSGLMFMGANEEQLILVHELAAPYPAYVLTLVGAGCMIFLWILLLINFYLRLVGYDEDGELDKGYQSVGPNEVEQFELSDLSDGETPQSRD
ncbi:protein Ytp1p [[Candida] jaroonii]|uniref:Protein Ytp1p n=1 Tax=[Candida] jaroonii TaxID=467808 RepID=A0ACA9XZZ8_9ASCO|nr:protein Ytp1p [[Candida] jaroonii]